MEVWYLNLDFFFQLGGGLIFDLGLYYVINLVQLFGFVWLVLVMVVVIFVLWIIGFGLWVGEIVFVDILINIYVLLEFYSGVLIIFSGSWDVWVYQYLNMELYGEIGLFYVLDLNFFGGDVMLINVVGEVIMLDYQGYFYLVLNMDDYGD